MLGTFALMTFASFEAVNPLPLAAQMWNSSREAAKRLFEVVDTEPVIIDSVTNKQLPITNNELRFTDLTFAYPTQSIRHYKIFPLLYPKENLLPLLAQAEQGKAH